jgi:anti-sigma regulatory factor (Ser/Thr protein kinase)
VSVDGRAIARRAALIAVRSRARSGVPLGEMCFPNVAESVALVRRFLAVVVKTHGVAHVEDTAALLVSELAGNATKYAVGAHPVRDVHTGRFEVAVSRRDGRLRVEVRDGCPDLPILRRAGVFAESGRGLFLVEQLADDHGAFRLPRGKAVWFELAAWDGAGECGSGSGFGWGRVS